MKFFKKYVQFNNIVFDDSEMIKDYDSLRTTTKTNKYEYSFDHGAYVAFKRKDTQLVNSLQLSMTIKLNLLKLQCDQREAYILFVKKELLKPGILWCVQGTSLLYAFAYVNDIIELTSIKDDYLELDLNFTLYEGYFHKADPKATFFVRYDACEPFNKITLNDDYNICDCLGCKPKNKFKQLNVCEDECEKLSKDNELAYNKHWLDKYYDLSCNLLNHKIVYDTTVDKSRGYTFKTENSCDGTIIDTFNSNTILPTSLISMEISGECLNNLMVTRNGNTNIISGEYSGTLIINQDGSIYNKCGDLIPMSSWSIPNGSTYGWEVVNGKNTIRIDGCGSIKVKLFIDELFI